MLNFLKRLFCPPPAPQPTRLKVELLADGKLHDTCYCLSQAEVEAYKKGVLYGMDDSPPSPWLEKNRHRFSFRITEEIPL